ncbi:MAG TPA: hypothetical protein VKI17_06795 [Gemmataceae bacterium]|nr:hypothetical protein [Gemmataceae bacterium]
MPALHLATFACDVTPPAGHPLCGGWIEPVRAVDDPLRALGVILLGMGRPVVLCAVDWCGIRNDANLIWRKALAGAAHTVPENVALQSVHPHDAPFADVEAERLLEAVPGAPPSLDLKFFEQAVERTAAAAKEALGKTVPFTHIGTGQARVEKVASNRRLVGPDGKVAFWRGSSTKDKRAAEEPEGLIDPWLKTLSFWNGARPLVALSYYATHPMSHYGRGHVSADFCALARQKRQEEEPSIFQIYFTGCSGNIAAGKYNTGAPENRPILRDRIYAALTEAWKGTERHPVTQFQWRVEPVHLPARHEKNFGAAESRKVLDSPKEAKARRGNAAFQLAWLKRLDRPIDLTCLDLGKALVLQLPGEPFIEYQLRAQVLRQDAFVCVAGYGDDGPGYIPPAKAYFEGGYETTVALAGPESERILTQAMTKLLQARQD